MAILAKMGRQLYLLVLLYFFILSVYCDSGEEAESESGSGEEEGEEYFKTDAEKVSFLDIIELSISHMVNGSNAKEKGELLNEYFFTTEKEDSIWPKVIKETEKITKVEFKERELADMENAIKHIFQRILECNLSNTGKKGKNQKNEKAKDLVKCYLTLGEFIEDGFVDFGFPRGTISGQTHMFEMNMAYNVMVLLFYHMLSGMEQAAMSMNSFETQLQFYRIAESFVLATEDVSQNAVDFRLEAISQPEICNIREALWQEFPVDCESSGTINAGRKRRDISNVGGIGGSADVFKHTYRAQVKDTITGEIVCNNRGTTDEKNDAKSVKEGLRSGCTKERDNYLHKAKAEAERFYGQRARPVLKELPKLWGSSKTNLSKVKEELEQRKKKNNKSGMKAVSDR